MIIISMITHELHYGKGKGKNGIFILLSKGLCRLQPAVVEAHSLQGSLGV